MIISVQDEFSSKLSPQDICKDTNICGEMTIAETELVVRGATMQGLAKLSWLTVLQTL